MSPRPAGTVARCGYLDELWGVRVFGGPRPLACPFTRACVRVSVSDGVWGGEECARAVGARGSRRLCLHFHEPASRQKGDTKIKASRSGRPPPGAPRTTVPHLPRR